MKTTTVDPRKLGSLSRLIIAQFNELGIDPPVDASGVILDRCDLFELYSTESVVAAVGTETNFFQKTRAGTGAHTLGLGGTNLDQPNGVLDPSADVMIVGIGVDLLIAADAGDTLIDDVAKVRNYGMIKEILLSGRRVMEPAFISSFPIDRGFSMDVGATGHDAAAVNVDQVVNGRPGGAMIRRLPPSNRIYVPAGERIDVKFAHFAAAALSTTLDVRVHLLAVKMQDRSPNPGR